MDMDFWAWLAHTGLTPNTDPTYYSSGEAAADPGAYEHALRTAIDNLEYASDPTAKTEFYRRLKEAGGLLPEDDANVWAAGQGGDIEHLISAASERFRTAPPTPSGPTDAGGGVTVGSNAPAEENVGKTGVGAGGPDPATQLTILTSQKMRWFFDPTAGKWYVSYGLPNSSRYLLFEADPDQMDSLFGVGRRPVSYETKTFSNMAADENSTFAGNIAEMQGTGTFESEYQKAIDVALDGGSLPSWMVGSAEAMDVLFIAQAENKNNDWVMDQFAKLPEFKTRFPNIQKLKDKGNLTLVEAVSGFLEFEAGLRQAQSSFGNSPESVTPAIVGGLIDRGWSLKDTNDALKTYDRMKKFAPAMEAFNAILNANGLPVMTTEAQWFDFMQGRAPQAVYDIYEASSIQEAATQAGLGDIFDAEDAIEASLAGNYTLDNATESMQKAAQLLLRLRAEVDVGRYDLNQDDLIDVSLGLAPSSGLSQVEVFDRVNRATLAAQANLRGRVQPYKAFSQQGIPQATSLSALRQES